MPRLPLRFSRVLLKLSGEALMGRQKYGIDPKVLHQVSEEILSLQEAGVSIAVVIGGGNIFRGLKASQYGLGRVPADHMGMLATVMNSIALGEVLRSKGAKCRVMSAIGMAQIAETYVSEKAVAHLQRNRIVIIGAGTGNPYFSTDTAAALRALETGAEVLLKATKVDGVYDRDPEKHASSRRFSRLTYREVLKKNLQVMDLTAVSLAMEQNLPIIVFNLRTKGNIKRVVLREDVGTLISGGK